MRTKGINAPSHSLGGFELKTRVLKELCYFPEGCKEKQVFSPNIKCKEKQVFYSFQYFVVDEN